MRGLVGAIIGAALMVPLPSTAKNDPVSLAKTTKWEINYDEDSCHLLAGFGQADSLVLLNITRFEPDGDFNMMLFGTMFDTKRAWLPVMIRIGDGPAFERQAGSGTTGSKRPFLILMSLRLDKPVIQGSDWRRAPANEKIEAQTASLTISMPGVQSYRLETGSLAAPMQAMRACTDSLVASWGYDPVSDAKLSKRASPVGNPGSWVTTKDYPTVALRAAQNGLVQFRLDIDETGKVAGCRVLSHFKPDTFADMTCGLLIKRAKFKPAIDAVGKPVKSYFVNQIRFLIPED